MLRISLLQILAIDGFTNHQAYDSCLIQDHAPQISRRLIDYLLLNFRYNHWQIKFKMSYALLTDRNALWWIQ